jgi:hypothetical protein
MSPELDKWLVDLLDVCNLLISRFVLEAASFDLTAWVYLILVHIDLEFELILDMHPEHFQKVFRVHGYLWVSVLIQVLVFHQSLASVDFCLEILPIHEDMQEIFCRVKTEYLRDRGLRVVRNFSILNLVLNLIKCVDNFWNCYTDIPDDFWGALPFIVKLCGNNLYDIFDEVVDNLSVKNFLFSFLFLSVL